MFLWLTNWSTMLGRGGRAGAGRTMTVTESPSLRRRRSRVFLVNEAQPAPASEDGARATPSADAELCQKSEERQRQLLEYCGKPQGRPDPVRSSSAAAASAARVAKSSRFPPPPRRWRPMARMAVLGFPPPLHGHHSGAMR